MREIKFRAWDEFHKKMRSTDDLAVDQCWCWILDEDACDLKIMQYTGLKDSKGNEIWEGDIVEFFKLKPLSIGENGEYPGGYLDEKTRDEIVFKSGEFTTKNLNCWKHGANPVVVGNVYETPELIK